MAMQQQDVVPECLRESKQPERALELKPWRSPRRHCGHAGDGARRRMAARRRDPPWDGSTYTFIVTATAGDCRYTEAAISAGAQDVSLPSPTFGSGSNVQTMSVKAIFVDQPVEAAITGPSQASADPPRVAARHVSPPPATCH